MQIPLLHQQILLETERLRDLHRSVMSHSSPVPAAEMEKLLEEIRKLYGLVLQLNNENAIQLLNEIQLAVTQLMPQPAISSLVSAPVNNIKSGEINKNTGEAASIESSKQQLADASDKSTEKKRIVSDIHEMFHDAPKVADRFSDRQTLGEKIAGNDMKRVSDNLKTSIKDIKSAIGLNEKFQFINQLFKGDAKNYHVVIDRLNASASEEVALNHVREISETNNWESYPATAKIFIEIIGRRFSV